MRRRVQGTEHEYTLYCDQMSRRGIDPHTLGLQLLRESDLHAAGEFTTNQSRAYYDVGHLEISTPECSNPWDLVVWEKAGEKILDWLRRVMEEKYLSKGSRVWAFKNNTSPDGTSYGSHENYLVRRDVTFPARFVRELVPHLTTRIVYTGAGDLIDGKYVLSPMAYLTSTVVSGETMHDTGVINTRDEPHADSSTWRRLHVIVGDALMNEWAILLRHFTMTAVLQLMEEGALDDVPQLAHPVEDMWHNVETMRPDEWRVRLKDDRVVSPLDIQRYYLEKAEDVVDGDRERKVLRLWEEVLNGLERKESKKLARKVEWLDRYFTIEETRKRDSEGDVAMMACKQYSDVGADRGLFYRRQREGKVDHWVDEAQILHAIRHPPPDTRAQARAALCEANEVEAIDWSVVVVNDGGRRRVELPDPFATSAGG